MLLSLINLDYFVFNEWSYNLTTPVSTRSETKVIVMCLTMISRAFSPIIEPYSGLKHSRDLVT